MRPFVYLLLLTAFVSASVTCVSASTECERWYVAYRQELAHTRNVQRIAAARRRAKRKLAGYTKPAATKPVLRKHPLTRPQMMHKVDLACGVLPEGDADQPVIAEEIPQEFAPDLPLDTIDLVPEPPTGLIAENDVPPYEGGGTPPDEGGPYLPPLGGAPPFGYFPPGGGSPPSRSTPPPNTPPPSTPPPVVPEPSSLVLMLTGAAAGYARRRFSI